MNPSLDLIAGSAFLFGCGFGGAITLVVMVCFILPCRQGRLTLPETLRERGGDTNATKAASSVTDAAQVGDSGAASHRGLGKLAWLKKT